MVTAFESRPDGTGDPQVAARDSGRAASPPGDRIQLVDALRGAALAAIALVHFGEQYLGNVPPPAHASYAVHGTLDRALEAGIWLFLRGKGFGLFSFLFGLSFFLQMERAERRDPSRDFRPRFAWRLAILFGIGFLHGLVYNGDILTVYALLGLLLVPLYRVRDWVLVAVAALLLVGAPRVVQRTASGPESPAESAAIELRMNEAADRHWRALADGDLREIVRANATEGVRAKWEYQFGPMGRGFQTLGLFLLGLMAGRHRVLHQPEAHVAFWKRLLWWSGGLTLAIPLVALLVFFATRAAGGGLTDGTGALDPSSWTIVAALCAFDAWNAIMTLLYVAVLVLLFARPGCRSWLLRFAPVGRMALSSYVGQTVVGSLVFFGFGLAWLGRFGNSVTLPLGAAVFALQALACSWWLARFRFGPLEWAWRSLTWLRWEPMVRRPPAASSR